MIFDFPRNGHDNEAEFHTKDQCHLKHSQFRCCDEMLNFDCDLSEGQNKKEIFYDFASLFNDLIFYLFNWRIDFFSDEKKN